MTLPLLLSVPHAGWRAPAEAERYGILTPDQVVSDGDVGAREIYGPLESAVEAFLTTSIARAFVDLNRAEDDRRKDGVVKTHTCWDEPVYARPLPETLVEQLLERYYRPYHRRLTELAKLGLLLAVDCHTMAAAGPPIGPDPGRERPWVCLSDADRSCPRKWAEALAACFARVFEGPVRINDPFRGGFITRSHAAEMPWVQLELSRAPFLSDEEKSKRTLAALADFVRSFAKNQNLVSSASS